MPGTVFLEVELVINTQSGLKIPVSSIVEKEFYTVPLDFLTLGDNGNAQGFLKEVRKGDASSSEFVSVTIYRRVNVRRKGNHGLHPGHLRRSVLCR